MNADKPQRVEWEKEQLQLTTRLAAWSLASGGTWVLAVLGARFLWDGNRTLSALAIALHVLVGLALFRAHRAYLASLDEMQQRVYLESMGLAFMIGIDACLVYFALAFTNLIEIRAEVAMLGIPALMCLVHTGGVMYGNFWKYR